MIVFDLRCGEGHVFEAWFGTGADFDDQSARGLVSCPVCGASDVVKAVMAPAVGAKSNRGFADAKALLLRAFIASVFDGIEDAGERERVEAAAQAALERML